VIEYNFALALVLCWQLVISWQVSRIILKQSQKYSWFAGTHFFFAALFVRVLQPASLLVIGQNLQFRTLATQLDTASINGFLKCCSSQQSTLAVTNCHWRCWKSSPALQPLSTLSSSNMVDYFLSLNVASSKNLADRARNFFHKHGISTWMCTDIEGGDTYRDQILGNVRDAKVFLIFLNEKWAQSQECTFEYNYAMRKRLVKEKPVIMPLVTESFDLEKYAHVDALMANCQGLFFSNVSLSSIIKGLTASILISQINPRRTFSPTWIMISWTYTYIHG